MPGPYSFPTDRVTGGPAPADDVNALGAALNESTDAATPSTLVLRDADGRFKAVNPTESDDVATMGWTAGAIASAGGGGGLDTSLQSGHWGLPGLVPWESGNETMDANRFYGQRFRVGQDWDYDRMAFKVQSSAAGNARVGTYQLVSGVWTLVYDAGAVSVASTGVKEFVVSEFLEPGDYVTGLVSSATIVIESTKYRHSMGMRDVGGNPIFGISFPRWWSTTLTYGALPSTLGLTAYLDWNMTFGSVNLRGA